MNIEQAKTISLMDILEKLGCTPTKKNGSDIWYLSPFRDEKTASFHIHTGKNVWHDFGTATGGDIIAFAGAYLHSRKQENSVSACLRWLGDKMPTLTSPALPKKDMVIEPPAFSLNAVGEIKRSVLIEYLDTRGVTADLAKRYLKEAFIRNNTSGKMFFSLALRNEEDGYELRNPHFKGCIGAKAISFIRGTKTPPDEIHVFEGAFDFLSSLAQQKQTAFEGDVIVLNSVALLKTALPYIKDYSYTTLWSWLDNDRAGQNATQLLEQFAGRVHLSFKRMNQNYASFKDVNEWHVHRLTHPKLDM